MHEELFNFINSAENQLFLVMKLIILFCYFGALRMSECAAILQADVTLTARGLLVKIIRKKTDKASVGTTFVVPNLENLKAHEYNPIDLYKDYIYQTAHVTTKRLFVKYNPKTQEYVSSPIGKNTMAKYPSRVAEFLKLDNPSSYTGHSLRATSATILADSRSSLENLKCHGGWKSTSVAEGYVRESAHNKTDIAFSLTAPTTTTNTTSSSSSTTTNTSVPGVVFVNCVFEQVNFSAQK
jgi:integrase